MRWMLQLSWLFFQTCFFLIPSVTEAGSCIKVKQDSCTSLFVCFFSWWFWFVGLGGIQCDCSSSSTCHSMALGGKSPSHLLPEPAKAIQPTLSAAQSVLCSRLRVGPAPSTHITVKTSQFQTHSGIPMCKYTYTLSWTNFYTPLPTTVQQDLWGN